MYTPAGPAHLITNYSTHEEGISGCFCALYLTAIHDIHGMLDIGSEYAKDNVAMPWHKQAASKGDGFPPVERKPRARDAFSKLMAVMAVSCSRACCQRQARA